MDKYIFAIVSLLFATGAAAAVIHALGFAWHGTGCF